MKRLQKMTKKLFLSLVIVFCLAMSLVSAANFPFDQSNLPGAREARNMFAGQIPGHVDWNPVIIDEEVEPVVAVRNVLFNREVESTSQVQKFYVTFDVVNLVDREIRDVDVRVTLGVGDNYQQRVGHYNPIFDVAAEPLAPHEVRREKIAFDISPCDSGLKDLEFYVYAVKVTQENGVIENELIYTMGRHSFDVNVIQGDECVIPVEELDLIQNNIQYSIVDGKLVVDFVVINPNDFALNEIYMDVIAANVANWDAVVDIEHDVYEMRFNYLAVIEAHQIYNAHVEIPLPACFTGNLNMKVQSYSYNSEFNIKENLVENNAVYNAVVPCVPENNGVGDNGAEDLPIDLVKALNELEDKYKDYKDDFNEYSDAYENAENLNDKNRAERDLERLDQKLEKLDDKIDALQAKDEKVIENKAQRLENKVNELRNQIKALLTGKEVIDNKEPNGVDLGLKKAVNDVLENGFSATGLTVKVINWNEISWYILLIIGILIVLGLIIWILSYILNY